MHLEMEKKKLAAIQYIHHITPIEEADKKECVHVWGWQRVANSGTVVGDFPECIPKTDGLRVQSYPKLADEFKTVPAYYISTKMDGASVTMYWKDGHFGTCGRNYKYADDEKCVMRKYAHVHGIPERVAEINPPDTAIQGEFCGVGIRR